MKNRTALTPPENTRSSSGSRGLNDILGGGLPRGRFYLVEGEPGTGKTTLALQFVEQGLKAKEKVLYVTLSETAFNREIARDRNGRCSVRGAAAQRSGTSPGVSVARAEDALRRAHDALEIIVEHRTAALRNLSTRLLRVQDAERRRVARELHDGLGQYLVALKMNLDSLERARTFDGQQVHEAIEIVDRVISEARTLSHLLHPPLLDEAGFACAAQWFVEGFGKRSGIRSTLEMPPDLGRFSPDTERALFRILQEALPNVHRRSGSPAVAVRLTAEDSTVTLTIRDFGVGISPELLKKNRKSAGVGLAGIRERVKELGGSLEIGRSDEGNGTVLIAAIPAQASISNSVTGAEDEVDHLLSSATPSSV